MKVLHISAGSPEGGAAMGMLNLHEGLLRCGVESWVALGRCGNGIPGVIEREAGWAAHTIGRGRRLFQDRFPRALFGTGRRMLFGFGFAGHALRPLIRTVRPDVVHLHWPHDAIVHLPALTEFAGPVIWTIRDFWPLTGGCHYPLGCRRFESGCRDCPGILRLGRLQPMERLARRKNELFRQARVKFVAISPWLEAAARKSAALAGLEVGMIPNCIRCDVFRPSPKNEARRFPGVSGHQLCIAVGSRSLCDPYKGFDVMADFLAGLPADAVVVAFGQGGAPWLNHPKVRWLGPIRSVEALREVYSAADVFVCPSKEEAFGKTVFEALACGTSVVAFADTGAASLLPESVVVAHVRQLGASAFLEAALRLARHSQAEPEAATAMARCLAQRFDHLPIAEAYAQFYRSCLGDRQQPAPPQVARPRGTAEARG